MSARPHSLQWWSPNVLSVDVFGCNTSRGSAPLGSRNRVVDPPDGVEEIDKYFPKMVAEALKRSLRNTPAHRTYPGAEDATEEDKAQLEQFDLLVVDKLEQCDLLVVDFPEMQASCPTQDAAEAEAKLKASTEGATDEADAHPSAAVERLPGQPIYFRDAWLEILRGENANDDERPVDSLCTWP